MSIARRPVAQGPEIKREIFFRQARIKKVFESLSIGFKNKPLEYIMAFCLATTAIGELIGRDYSVKWYLLISVFYVLLLVVKIVEQKHRDIIKINDGSNNQQPPKQSIS